MSNTFQKCRLKSPHLIIFIFIFLCLLVTMPLEKISAQKPIVKTAIHLNPKISYADFPLFFEANEGQADPSVWYYSRARGNAIFITANEAVLKLVKQAARKNLLSKKRGADKEHNNGEAVIRIKLDGADIKASWQGMDKMTATANYFLGKDRSKDRTKVPLYAQVKAENIYPGVDMVYYGNQRKLEYVFVVKPGTDPGVIRLKWEGAEDAEPDANGNLTLRTGIGSVGFESPVIYQEKDGKREQLEGHYVKKEDHAVGFEIKNYDRSRPLVIDPVVSIILLGGNGNNLGCGISVDPSGNFVYLEGSTTSTNLPATNSFTGTDNSDIFVAQFTTVPVLSLNWITYLGGSNESQFNVLGNSIAVDGSDNSYITGGTYASDFPVIGSGMPFSGLNDAFVAKFNSSGTCVVSTLLGGSRGTSSNNGDTWGNGIALDVEGNGNVFVTGDTNSSDFPLTSNAIQTTCDAISSAFVTELDCATLSNVEYSTFLGYGDEGWGIVANQLGSVFVAGETAGLDLPGLNYEWGASGAQFAFFYGFVSLLYPQPTASETIVSSAVVCGSQDTSFNAIAIDPNTFNIWVTGNTTSPNFNSNGYPYSGGNSNIDYYWGGDAFVAQFTNGLTDLNYFTYLGGDSNDYANAIAVGSNGLVYVAGYTLSSDGSFYNTPNFMGGLTGSDGFVAILNPAVFPSAPVLFSQFLGTVANTDSDATGIALDQFNNCYVGGWDPAAGADAEALVAKISALNYTPIPTATITTTASPAATVTSTQTATATATQTGTSTVTRVICGPVISDSFHRPNAPTLGTADTGQWWTYGVDTDIRITNNMADAFNDDGEAYIDSFNGDGTTTMVVNSFNSGYCTWEMYFRALLQSDIPIPISYWSVSGISGDQYYLEEDVDDNIVVFKNIGPVAADGDTITATYTGSSVQIYINWNLVDTETDTALGSNTVVGMHSYNENNTLGSGYVSSFTSSTISGCSPTTTNTTTASTTGTPTYTATPFVPSCVQLKIAGNSSEVPNGNSNGNPVYPTKGYQGTVHINGTGSVNYDVFEPLGSATDGVYFEAGKQQVTNSAWYSWTGPEIGNIFNSCGGDVSFYLKGNETWAARQTENTKYYVFDVTDTGSRQVYYFYIQPQSGYLTLVYQTNETSGHIYYVPTGQEDATFGNGAIMKVRLRWDGTNNYLYINHALVQTISYTAATDGWGSNSMFNFGATTMDGGYPGYFSCLAPIADFQISTSSSCPCANTTTTTPTSTYTLAASNTYTQTATATQTPTQTLTLSVTVTSTETPTATITLTATAANTATQTATITGTSTMTSTGTATVTTTSTATTIGTNTQTQTATTTGTAVGTFTFTPTNTVTPFNPSCVQMLIDGNSSEVPSGYGTNGLPVFPAQGYQGTVRINSGGSVNFSAFEPVGSATDGVYFGAASNNQSGWYSWTGPQVGNIFNSCGGDVTFYLKSNESWTARKTENKQYWVFDVTDNGTRSIYDFYVSPAGNNLALYFRTNSATGTFYYVPSGQEDVTFGNGVIMKVRLGWDGTHTYLYINDVLVQTSSYTAATNSWGSSSMFNLGATAGDGGYPGYYSCLAPIADFRISTAASCTCANTTTSTYTITLTPSKTQTATATASKTSTATVTYTQASGFTPGFVRGGGNGGVSELSLGVYHVENTATAMSTPTVTATWSYSEWLTASVSLTYTNTITMTPTPVISALGVQNVIPYPNPLTKGDVISLSYFLPTSDVDSVTIRIYTISARLIKVIGNCPKAYGTNSIMWDVKDANGFGLSNGLYFYSVEVVRGSSHVRKAGKIAITR